MPSETTHITKINAAMFLSELNRGKHRAFEVIFYTYYRALCYFADGFVSDKAVAHDIVSDVLIQLWTNRERIREYRQIKGFLYLCTRNACLNYLRRERHAQQYKNSSINALILEQSVDGVSDKIFDAEVIRSIYEGILTLPAQCRRVLTLHLQGLETDDIAQMLGLAPQSVRNTKARAAAQLKRYLLKSVVTI